MKQLAHYDVLTNLPNRVLFYERLKSELAEAVRLNCPMAVLFIDVDRFKYVNDTLGHAAGDKLLQQVAGRLSQAVRARDTVGRLGGDEFPWLPPAQGISGREGGSRRRSSRVHEPLEWTALSFS